MFRLFFPVLCNIGDILTYIERCENIPSANAYDLLRKDFREKQLKTAKDERQDKRTD